MHSFLANTAPDVIEITHWQKALLARTLHKSFWSYFILLRVHEYNGFRNLCSPYRHSTQMTKQVRTFQV